jgi:molecular chaperone DnaK
MKAIGIDLGTTYSAIAQWRIPLGGNNAQSVVYNLTNENRPVCASKLFIEYLDGTKNIIVGRVAILKGQVDPHQYVTSVKRLMDSNKPIAINGERFTPVELSAEIIKYLLKQVENQEGPGKWIPNGIVVTVPYYFRQNQNDNTKAAALKAISDTFSERMNMQNYKRYGETLQASDLFLDLLPEPVAAGLDYAFTAENVRQNEVILVFDLGGGTFDLTITNLTINQSDNGSNLTFEVLAIDGDPRLGGEDFDESLLKFVLEKEEIDISSLSERDKGNLFKKIIPEIMDAKETLASVPTYELIIGSIAGIPNIDRTITKLDLVRCLNGEEGSKRDYLGEIKSKIDELFAKANITADKIYKVLLTGGSSRLRAVIDEVLFPIVQDRSKIREINNLELAVARGAAAWAAYKLDLMAKEKGVADNLSMKEWNLIEITQRNSHDLGLKLANNRVGNILRGNSVVPAHVTRNYYPTLLSSDGKYAECRLVIGQGKANDFTEIGRIDVGKIYTHGRAARDININITYIVDSTSIKVKVHVPKGNADGSDMVFENQLSQLCK